jgi:iron complex outermembrane receptor protein
MKRYWAFLLLGVFFLPAIGSALEKEKIIHKLDEIVVTSTRKAKAVDTPASLSIITGEELEEMGAKNIVEALGKIPGVVDSSTKGRSVVVRGNKSAMSGGPVILIDGVPQKMGDYRYSQFDFISISQIDRIEVLRSAGITYGPGAARDFPYPNIRNGLLHCHRIFSPEW